MLKNKTKNGKEDNIPLVGSIFPLGLVQYTHPLLPAGIFQGINSLFVDIKKLWKHSKGRHSMDLM